MYSKCWNLLFRHLWNKFFGREPIDVIASPNACLRCGRIPKVPYEDCWMGKEVEGGGTEPHIFTGDPLTETEKDVLDGVGMTEDVAPIHNPHVCDGDCDHGYDESAAEDELESEGNEP